MGWKFYELLTTFEFSYFQMSLFTTSKYFIYPGKFMGVFDILQHLGNIYLNICQVCTRLSFSFLWRNFWGQISLFPGVSWYFYICNYSHNKFYEMRWMVSSVRWQIHLQFEVPSKQLFFLFSLQECGSLWCRWRPDCATYCPASWWRHAKTHLFLLLLTQKLSYWKCMGMFDCPSKKCSSEIICICMYVCMYIHTHTHTQ